MEFITKEDFETHMYAGTIDAISDYDDEKLEEAIASAIGEACGYLSRFDLEVVLTSSDRQTYASLRTWVKDIAKWHFIAICNVNTDFDIAESRYKEAIKRLVEIQKGIVTPRGWAIPGDRENDTVFFVDSDDKRGNYY